MRPAATLIALVREIVDEPVAGLADATILASMNEALGLVAEKLTPTTLLVPFEAIEVYPGENVVPLADLREEPVVQRILSVHGSNKRRVKIFKRAIDAESEFAKNHALGQDPVAVLVSDNELHLIPGVNQRSTLYLSYVRKPDLYESEADNGERITFLPSTLGEKLVVNYAVAMAYRKIEDGVTDDNGNFKLYYELAMNAMNELEIFFGPEAKQARPETVSGADEIAGPYQASDPFLA